MRSRAVLIGGPARPLAAAVARRAALAGMTVALQAGRAETSAATRLAAAVAQGGGTVRPIAAELGGDDESRALMAAAAKALRPIDAVVICTDVFAFDAKSAASLAAWPAQLARPVRTPFFLAKQAAAMLQRRGGRLLLAWTAPPHDDDGLASVAHESLLCLIDALPRAVATKVAVAAVIGRANGGTAGTRQTAAGVVGLLEVDPPCEGAVLRF